jgi:type IV pilus assembly protein PilC
MADIPAAALHKQANALNSNQRIAAVNSQQICEFTRQLATLVGAGVPLLQALDTIQQGIQSQAIGPVVQQLRRQIAAGLSLELALQKSGVFDNLYCQMVAAGELAGNLDDMLNRLATHTDRQQQLHRKVRMALVYPMAVLLIAALVITVILIWVVPVFQSIFASFGAQLPAPTRLVLGLSAGLLHWGLPALVVSALIVFAARWKFRRSESWQWQWALWNLKLPLIAGVVRTANLAAWTRCLSMLTQSGVPLLDALEVLAGVCNNRVYALTCWRIRQSVLRGNSLAKALEDTSADTTLKSGLFPPLLVQMIDIGEQSGTLTALLSKAADAQDDHLELQVQGLTQLIEPLMVVVLGGLVGGMVVALYLPVFQLGQIL